MSKRVLFLCTGNSARSQMAESWLRHLAGDEFEAHSAGSHPKGVHPLAIDVMTEVGVATDHLESKSVDVYLGEHFDTVITVCDNARQACPVFPGARAVHWSLDDPAAATGDPGAQREEFRRIRDEIAVRIRDFVQTQEG